MLTARRILKEIGSPYLALYNGGDYWYFKFDDGTFFETQSVMVPRLRDLSLRQWVAEGREFLARIER